MIDKVIEIERIEDVINVFGSFDQNLRILEGELGVKVLDREDVLHVCGEPEDVILAEKAIGGLLTLASKGETINDQNVRYVLKLVRQGREDKISELVGDVICITANGKPIKPKTIGQKLYCDAIASNTITVGEGPAGTGKSYLAVAAAVAAFRAEEVNRIILTRPAVEAGERLGFLPGDLQSKVDPYLRPLYDALFDMLGVETYQKYLLTRLGFGSKMVITGDVSQIDLPEDKTSGLKVAIKVLDGIDDVAICTLTGADVVRHRLVQRIIESYEEYEKKQPKTPEPGRPAAGKKYRRRPER